MGRGDELLKLFRKRLLVEEDPRVVVFAVEPILELAYGLHGAFDLRVLREHEERRICEVARWW